MKYYTHSTRVIVHSTQNSLINQNFFLEANILAIKNNS